MGPVPGRAGPATGRPGAVDRRPVGVARHLVLKARQTLGMVLPAALIFSLAQDLLAAALAGDVGRARASRWG